MIRKVQSRLGLTPTGVYGQGLKYSVENFQRTNGLYVDGITGQKTLEAMGITQRITNGMTQEEAEAKYGKIIPVASSGATRNDSGLAIMRVFVGPYNLFGQTVTTMGELYSLRSYFNEIRYQSNYGSLDGVLALFKELNGGVPLTLEDISAIKIESESNNFDGIINSIDGIIDKENTLQKMQYRMQNPEQALVQEINDLNSNLESLELKLNSNYYSY
jgi:peptidoglycan hydrolase-like protein with peptidoglycan-binding domain